jgi:hypothetical protein
MFDDTKIKEKISSKKFLKTIREYSAEKIECTSHTFFRLSQKQREIFTSDELKEILLTKIPFLVGIQNNDNHAVFYKYGSKNLKMILNINKRKVNIVTFYFIEQWQIPKI